MPQSPSALLKRIEELRADIRRRPPQNIAELVGARYHAGANATEELLLSYWGRSVSIGFPDLIARDVGDGEALDPLAQAMLAYYLHSSDGTLPAGRWIAFSELPDGAFYASAHQGYTGQVLQRHFGADYARFRTAAETAGGRAVDFADAAFAFQALPRVQLLVACWQGDEDFPPSYRILFDAHIAHHLPTEGCAILGSMLTRLILRNDAQTQAPSADNQETSA